MLSKKRHLDDAGGPLFALLPFLDVRSAMCLLQALSAPVPAVAIAGAAGFGMPTFTDDLTQRVVTARNVQSPFSTEVYYSSLLHEKVRYGNLEDVRWLLERRAISHAVKGDPKDFSLLGLVIYYGKDAVTRLALVRALCDAGASPDNHDLCNAIRWQRVEVVRELIDRGARISVMDAIHEADNLWNKYLVVEDSSPLAGGGGGARAAAVMNIHIATDAEEISVSIRGGGYRYFSHAYVEGDNASMDAALDKALDYVIEYITTRNERHFHLWEADRDHVPFDELREAMARYLRVSEEARGIMRLVLDHPPDEVEEEEEEEELQGEGDEGR